MLQAAGRTQATFPALSYSARVPHGHAEKKGRGETYEVILLHKRNNVQRLEVRQARSKLWEELVGCGRVDNKDRQAPDGRRSAREHFESAVAVFREERE
jgi:hypothetical protein